ncbi:MAG: trigger factor [Gemmataceae bacterium]
MSDEARTEEATEETQATTVEEKKPEKLKQQAEISDVGPCKKHIKVTIDRDDVEKRLNVKFSELVADSNVAGFRPGKAPRKVVERRYRKDVTDQVKAEIMLQSLEQLTEDHDIAPLSSPEIDPMGVELPKEGPMVYEFDVEVRPEFDLPNYKGLKLKRPMRTFTDADIEREERRLLAPYGQLIPKDGKSELGDTLIANITFQHDGKTLGEVKEVPVRIEKQVAFRDCIAPKFAEQTEGVTAGESRTVDFTFLDNVADPAIRGASVQAKIEVQDLKTTRPPELTHEFLHTFGVHSPEQLRELIQVGLNRRLEYDQRQAVRRQVLEHITAASTWDLPQDILHRQARNALARRVMEMRAAGMSDDEIRGRQKLLERDILQSTALALKEHFVLQKIAEVEKIEVNDNDIEDEIERLAGQYDESPRRIRAKLQKEDMIDALAIELIERKVIDLILANAEYEDVSADPQEDVRVATVEEQAVAGDLVDPTAPPEEKSEDKE